MNNELIVIESPKSPEAEMFKNLNINEEELFNKNSFLTNKLSNQLISLDLSTEPPIYSYYATTSLNDFIKSLKEQQGTENSTFILYANENQTLTENIKEVLVNEKTSIYIYGDSSLDFNNLTIKLSGTIETEAKLNNIQIEKTSSTANFINKNNKKDV